MEQIKEAVYLINDERYLHLRENGAGVGFATYNKVTGEPLESGQISEKNLPPDGRNAIPAARNWYLFELSDDDRKAIQQESVKILENIPQAGIGRRRIWEPETLPKDIRLINSHYDDLYRMDEIEEAIEEAKAQVGEHFTVKQLEKLRKSLKQKLEKLQGTDRKDDVVTFEQLGVDRLFVDESQAFKNLYLYTKMRNVAGLSTSEAQKSSDMFGKCRYLDEITGGRGVIFATGTPLSNSMTEMYTLMRYLQYNTLQQKGLTHFDAWASTFGETTTAIELAPEGYTLIGR